LSVFRGGFDLQAAEKVCDASLTLLTGLTDKSLIRLNQGGRYDLHELVRQYAAERLQVFGENTTTQHRHLEYFIELSRKAYPHYYNVDETVWLDRLDIEHDNLRAALGWALESGELEAGLQLAGNLGWFWRKQFFRSEGRTWLDKFLAGNKGASTSR